MSAGGICTWAYSTSTDGGATWAAQTVFFGQDTIPYLRICSNGLDRVDFAMSGSPNVDSALKICHFYYSGGNYYKTDGTQISASLPLTVADITVVHTDTDKVWVHDIQRNDSNGHIVIVFSKFVSTTDHRYYYAKWEGSGWQTNEIVAAGQYLYAAEPYYSGGIVIDPSNLNVVYLSRQINGIFEIWKYITDDGSTWTGTAITQNSVQNNCRPVVIRNNDIQKILWWEGLYSAYTSYKTQIKSGIG
jgi:hypothetical protein